MTHDVSGAATRIGQPQTPLLWVGPSVLILRIGAVEYYKTLKMDRDERIYWSRWHKVPKEDRNHWRLGAFELADRETAGRAMRELTKG